MNEVENKNNLVIIEKNFAKANKDMTVCQGKPLECFYYKDCGTD